MSTVTLEHIKAEHQRLGQLIAQLTQAPTPTRIVLAAAEIVLQQGEAYAGLVLDADGKPLHHLVLLPDEAEDLTWEAACRWAASIGGELPTRQEQALLYANAKRHFKPEWYWSSEQHGGNGSYAWFQLFTSGYQYDDDKSYEGRARAVRRFAA